MGKAKNKILKIDEKDFEQLKSDFSSRKYHLRQSEDTDPGHVTSHTDYFKSRRRERLDHRTTETNKLIIRLDRLLRVHATDRRNEEQKIVAWLDGTNVSRCPSCASSFNITRRQHHCRLCGSVMCNACSDFLAYDAARSLIAPVNLESNGSLQSTSRNDTESIRICNHCMQMLETRRTAQVNQSVQPTICKLYDSLQIARSELHQSVELYHKIHSHLTSGSTSYQLQDAQSLKSSIARQTEALDLISKKIAAMNPETEDPRALTLQNTIRRSISNYIKENVLSLPTLPTPAELEKIKKESLTRHTIVMETVPAINVKKVTVTTGWSPANLTAECTVDEPSANPLLEQIRIVESYIKQAQGAGRFEEVRSLRENLAMLKLEYEKERSTV